MANSGNYRGVKWNSLKDLSSKLGCSPNAANTYIARKNCTAEEFIDHRLQSMTYKEYVANGYSSQAVTYRGISFDSVQGLADKLQVNPDSIRQWRDRNPNAPLTDYIDYRLKEDSYEDYLKNGGVGYHHHKGYAYKNVHDLAKVMGISCGAITSYLRNHPRATEKDFIDYTIKDYSYRGVNCKKPSTVAKDLGVSTQAVYNWVYHHPNASLQAYVDVQLYKQNQNN